MDIKSIKQFAEEQNVSYEAIRKQIVRYGDELKEHIIRKNRTQYLDEWAINFLKEKRKESPIILMNMDQNQEIEEMKVQIDLLKSKLLVAQEQIITLQDEAKKTIEDKAKYTILLEDNKAKEEKMNEMSRQLEEKDNKIQTMQKEAEELTKERDEAQTEAQSFTRSLFGFYRKK